VVILSLGSGENVFSLKQIDLFNKELDKIEGQQNDIKALVITAQGKFFSNGLDLTFLSNPDNAQKMPAYLAS